MKSEDITKLIQRLVDEGEKVVASQWEPNDGFTYVGGTPQYVDLQKFSKWTTGCQNLIRLLGKPAEQWATDFAVDRNDLGTAMSLLGTLQAIQESVKEGLLISFADIVRAEEFDSPLEQADHLYSQDHFLAAGVLGRAVLEDHLRSLCANKGFQISKQKPTLNDFNAELYRQTVYPITVMKHIDSLAAIGNLAAHNLAGLVKEDVGRLLREVRDLLVRLT